MFLQFQVCTTVTTDASAQVHYHGTLVLLCNCCYEICHFLPCDYCVKIKEDSHERLKNKLKYKIQELYMCLIVNFPYANNIEPEISSVRTTVELFRKSDDIEFPIVKIRFSSMKQHLTFKAGNTW